MELSDVKKFMASKIHVSYGSIPYIIIGCTLRIRNGQWYYQVELQDIKAPHSVVIADMSKV